MNHIFIDMLREKWLKIYMDDLGVHTKNNIDLHHECTQWVLQCLQEHGLLIKLSKCIFDACYASQQTCVKGLGFTYFEGGVTKRHCVLKEVSRLGIEDKGARTQPDKLWITRLTL